MPSVYTPAPLIVSEIAKELIQSYHLDLETAGVKIDYVFAHAKLDESGEKLGPAITCGGYEAIAVARVLNLKDRVMGRGDCEITIDGDQWLSFTEAQHRAMLDHELYHFEVKRDKYGAFEHDDHNRPRIKLRKHDFQAGWFHEIAKRHGDVSFEKQQFRQLYDEAGQIYFSFETLPTGV